MNTAPGRLSDKTELEKKIVTVRWPRSVTGGVASSPQWTSEPAGLSFVNPDDPNADPAIAGELARIRIEQGARGQKYRVRHGVTVQETGEYLEITSNGQPGLDLQITGYGRSGSDYRWTAGSYPAYG